MHTPVEQPTDGRPIHTLTLRVRPDDVVGDWHVYYAAYLRYLEDAAIDHLRSIGFTQEMLMETLRMVFVVRHLEIDYQGSARADDELQITTWVESARGASLVRCSEIRKADSHEILIVARMLWVWVDENARPRRIPREIIAGLLPSAVAPQVATASP